MTADYRSELFSSYHTRTADLDAGDEEKLDWFRWYLATNYRTYLPPVVGGSNAKILEIGCNKGYLLRALADCGYADLTGIDLSSVDVEVARRICPTANLSCEDAFEFLQRNHGRFSLIIIKAVLEHIPKARILPLIDAISAALTPGGRVIIDVPNMDWLFASHERFMDFTHEVGFTQESLAQVMRIQFGDVVVVPVETSNTPGMWNRVIRNCARGVLSSFFSAARLEWPGRVTWCRALLGIGTKTSTHE